PALGWAARAGAREKLAAVGELKVGDALRPNRRQASSHNDSASRKPCAVPVGAGLPAIGLQSSPQLLQANRDPPAGGAPPIPWRNALPPPSPAPAPHPASASAAGCPCPAGGHARLR